MSEQLDELRESFDGSDQFMSGHQIHKTRQGRKRGGVPEWATDDVSIRKIVFQAFPKMFTDKKQRERAGVWVRVAYLYYRSNLTDLDIALEMGVKRGVVRNIIHRMNLVYQGKWANGRGDYGRRKRGRPRKGETNLTNGETNPTSDVVLTSEPE